MNKKNPAMYFHKETGKEDLQGFYIHIDSDVDRVVGQMNDDGPKITTEVSPYIVPEVSLIKKFRFYLDAEDGQALASAFVFFVNSDLFFKRKFPLEQLAKDRRIQKVALDARMLGWFQTGTNFVFFEDIFVSPAAKGNNFIEWLLVQVPRLLSDAYGLTIQKVAVPFAEEVTEDDFKRHPELEDDEIGCRRFANQKRLSLERIMKKLGYKRSDDSGRAFFFCNW